MISIGKNAPAASGVYGLSDARRWIYVGETANIQAELYRLLQFSSPLLRDHAPSGFTFELSSAENRLERQNRLVFELAPIGNARTAQLPNRPAPGNWA